MWGKVPVCVYLELIGQLQTCSVYLASLFRWLARHKPCTIFAVLLGSLLDVIEQAIWSHSLVAIIYQLMTGRMILEYLREAAQKQAPWNAFTGNKCNYHQGACDSKRCHCKKMGIDCSSHCHRGEDCKNKQYDGGNQTMTTTETQEGTLNRP